jgi:hypothetical protein
MKATELRIGNLVLDTKGNINKVDSEALIYMSKEVFNYHQVMKNTFTNCKIFTLL